MTTYYHGTSHSFDTFNYGDGSNTDVYDENVDAGVFLTTEAADASFYAGRSAENNGGEATVLTCRLVEGVKVVDYDDNLYERFPSDASSDLVDWCQAQGYDALSFSQGGDVNTPGTILVFDPDHIIITK